MHPHRGKVEAMSNLNLSRKAILNIAKCGRNVWVTWAEPRSPLEDHCSYTIVNGMEVRCASPKTSPLTPLLALWVSSLPSTRCTPYSLINGDWCMYPRGLGTILVLGTRSLLAALSHACSSRIVLVTARLVPVGSQANADGAGLQYLQAVI